MNSMPQIFCQRLRAVDFPRFKPIVSSLVLAGIVVVSVVGTPAFAQRNPERPNIEDLLPETTVAFVQIKDIKDLAEKAMNGSGMKMYEDEKVGPLVDRIVEEGRKAYGKIEEEVGLSLDELQSIPAGEIVICGIAPRRKKPCFMVIFEVGEENESAEKAMGVLTDRIKESGNEVEDGELDSGAQVEKIVIDGTPVWIAKRDGVIVGCSNEKVLNNFFLRWDGEEVKKVRPLSKNRKFVTIMNRCRSQKELESEIRFFFDPIGLFKSFARGEVEMQVAIAFLPTLGLDSFLGFGGAVILGDEEYESIMHAHLLLSSPRKGITNMFALKPADYEPEDWMPSDVHWYTSTSWDVKQTYAEIRGMVDLAMGEDQFDEMVQTNIDERISMSLEDDILSQLSGRISLSNISAEPGKLNSASWLVGIGLNDVEDAKEVTASLFEFVNENDEVNFEESEYKGITFWSLNQESFDERNEQRAERRRERNERRGRDEMNEIESAIRMPFPTFSFIGNSLVITDSKEAFEKAVAVFNGEGEPLKNDVDFVKMAEKMTRLLGTDMPVAVSYNQPKNQFQGLLDMANADSTKAFVTAQAENENEFFSVLKGVMDDHELPDMDTLSKYIMPSGSFATSDDTGYHMLWFQERLVLEDE